MRITTAAVSFVLIFSATSAHAAWTGAPNSPYNLPGGSGAQLIANGDFNRDGYSDIITANTNLGTVSVFFGDGTGVFSSGTTFACGSTPVEVITADLNRDGKLDIIVGNFVDPGTITVLYGNGSGGVASTRTYSAGVKPLGIVCQDCNGDGKPDLAFTNPTNVNVWLGDGTGNFTPAPGSPFGTRGLYPEFLCSADLNNDGVLDLAVTNFNSGNVSIFFGDGSGRFTEINASPFASGAGTTQIKPGDFNGDGRMDLAIANQNNSNVTVLLNLGGGNFSSSGTGSPIAVGTRPVELLVADFDGDGRADIVTSSLDTGGIALLGGNGNGTFRSAVFTNTGQKSPGVTAGQFNGGGLLDLAVCDTRGNQMFVLLNNADQQGPGLFRFSTGAYSANENGGYVDITVLRVNGNTEAASITVQSSDGSAQSGSDYTALSRRLDFAAGDISKTLRISIAGDSWYEGAETFDLNLSGASNGAGLATPSSSRVTIQDAQPAPQITFDASSYSLNERDGSLTFHVHMSGPAQNAISVQVNAVDGSAESGSDYVFGARTLTFNPGETDTTLTLQVFDDGVYEGDESFQLRLSSATNGAVAGPSATVTITDAQSPGVVAFASPVYQIAETAGTLSVNVTLAFPAQRDTYVDLAAVNHEARNGFDYSLSSQRVHFGPLEQQKTVSIGILADNTFEGNETFSLQLSNVTGGGVLSANPEALVTIIDAQEPGSISFSTERVDTLANPGTVTLTVKLSQPSENPMSVNWRTVERTARSSLDYTSASGTLTFPGGSTEEALTVQILERSDRKGDEQFAVELSAPTLGAHLGPTATGIVAIITPAALPDEVSTSIVIGDPVRFDLPVRGSAPIAVTTGTLPPGLSFDGTAITGVATDIGAFSIEVHAANPWATTHSTLTLVVLPRPQSGPSLTTLDSDGDAFPDELEALFGSNPESSASVPTGASPHWQAVSKAQLSIKLGAGAGSDSLSLSAMLPGAVSGDVTIDVGGVIRTVSPGAKARNRGLSFRLSGQKTGVHPQKFSFRLAKEALAASLRDEGLDDTTVTKRQADIPVLIMSADQCYSAVVHGTYSARLGRGGKFSGSLK